MTSELPGPAERPASTTASSGNLLHGAVLARCRIERCLATGGMGAIYLAHHEALDKVVALKVLPPNLAQDPEYQKRFLREARAAAKLEHPNIVQIYDAGNESDTPYMVMQYIEGQDLQQLLDRKVKAPLGDALGIAKKVAQALGYAHKLGIVHRDIKPSNIMISKQGKVMVTDFGLARQISGTMSATVTQGGIVMGTPDYISPEQAMGERTDGRTDIYSLGCTLYRMLAGQPPYPDDNPVTVMMKHVRDTDQPKPLRQIDPEIPESVEQLVRRMMAKHPAERFQTMEEVIAGIDAARGKGQGAASGVGTAPVPGAKPPAAPGSPESKRTMLLIAAGSAVVTIILLILLGIFLRPSAAERALREAKTEEARGDKSPDYLKAARHRYQEILQQHPGTRQAEEAAERLKIVEAKIARVEALGRLGDIEAAYRSGRRTYAVCASDLREMASNGPDEEIRRQARTVHEDLSRAEVLSRAQQMTRLIQQFEAAAREDREPIVEKIVPYFDPEDIRRVQRMVLRAKIGAFLSLLTGFGRRMESIEALSDGLVCDPEAGTASVRVSIKSTKGGDERVDTSPTSWVLRDDAWYLDLPDD